MDRRVWGVLGAVAAVLVAQVLMRPPLAVDETRYLSVAWEMHLNHDAFHLTRNFESYAHKPPLLFWLINLVWMAFGLTETAARLVGPAAAVATLWATGWLAARLYPQDPDIRFRATLVLAGFPLFLAYAGATMFDAMLSLGVLAGLAAIWAIGHGRHGWQSWLGLGLAVAFGAYAKGPVILVHLAGPLLLMRFWAPDPPGWRRQLGGLALALGVAVVLIALWLVPALMSGDAAYRQELLWDQTAQRVAGGLGHGRPFWFLIVLVPVLLFPFGWSFGIWRQLGKTVREDAEGRFLLIWGGGALLLFSLISGKQLHYLLPELPAVAILIARQWGRIGKTGTSFAPLLPLVLGIAAIAFWAGVGNRTMAELVSPGWVLLTFGFACLGLALLGWKAPLPGGHIAMGLGLMLAIDLLFFGTALHSNYDPKPIADRLAQSQSDGIALIGMDYSAEFNFAGRLTEPVAVPPDKAALYDWSLTHPDGLIFGPVKRVKLALRPAETMEFAGRRFGIWSARSLTFPEAIPEARNEAPAAGSPPS